MRRPKSKPYRLRLEELESRTLLSTFYVAPTGVDSAAGAASAPWQSLQHAADLVRAGDTVIVQPGTYAGFNLTTSGTASAPITFRGQSGVNITTPNSFTGRDGINLEGASYVVVDGFTVTGMSRAGIRAVTDNHVTIKNNTADRNGYWGVFTGFSDYVDIENNVTTNSQIEHGIYVSNSPVSPTIRNNVVYGNSRNGIHLNGDISMGGTGIVTGALIEGNIVHDNGVTGGSAINCDGIQNSRIQNNLLYNNHASGISLYCINAATGSMNNVVANNTIVMAADARWALNIQNGSTGNVVLNNVLYNNNPANGSIDISSDSLPGLVSDYNAVKDLFTPDDTNNVTLAQWQAGTGQDRHSVVAAPAQLFVNLAANDYHLAAASPALDQGTASLSGKAAPTADLAASVRPSGAADDIGAYETQLGTPTPSPTPAGPPASFAGRGVGGGGSLYSPSINPANANDLWISTDMSPVFHSTDGGASWQTANFNQLEGFVNSQVQFTEVSGLLYTINSATSAPAKSTDGGQTWQPLASDPTGGSAFYFYADPANHNHLLVTDYTTLYASTDGGATFHQVYQTTDTANGLMVGGAFFDGNTVYVGTSKGLLVSQDGGATFAATNYGGTAAGQVMVSFAGAKQNGVTRLFAVTMNAADVYAGVRGYDAYTTESVYTAVVGQGGWTLAQGSLASTAHPFFVSMASNNTSVAYLAGATDGSAPMVYKTTNGGASWQSVFQTGNNQNVNTGWSGAGAVPNWSYGELAMGFTVSAANPNQAIVSDYGFAYMTTDGGATWQVLNVVPASRNTVNTVVPAGKSYQSSGLDDTTVWQVNWADATHLIGASTDIHGVVSADGGTTWSSLYQGQPLNTLYRSVTAADGTVYAATASVHDLYQSTYLTDAKIDGGSGRLVFSTDKGATWQTLHDFGHPVVWVATDPNNPNRLYASVAHSTAGGIYVTTDLQNGANSVWTKLATPPRTMGHPLDIQVLRDGTLVVSYSGRRDSTGAFTASSGVFVSTDGGQSWQDRSAAGMQYWTQDVVIDPNDATQNTWYAGVYGGWGGPASGLGGLYKTTDRGQTWTRIFASNGVTSATLSPVNPGEMYVTTEDSGLWYTSNLNSSSPTFNPVSAYPFAQPLRVFYNPYNTAQVWVTSFGNGMMVGSTGAATTPPQPTATISGPSSGVQGQTLTYTLGASETGLAAGTAYTFAIDWDGNGTTDQTVTGLSGTQVNHAFTGTGACTVTVTAADPLGNVSVAAPCPMTLTANQPTAGVSGTAAGTAGQALTFTLSASEPYQASGAGYTFRVNWGDGSTVQTVTGVNGTAAGHTFANAGSYTVQVTATDSYGNTSAAATAAVAVAVNRPTATVSGPSSGVQGQTLTYTLGASETGLAAGTAYTFAIDWDGNGTTDQTVTGLSGTQVNHAFAGTGACTVTVTATDPSGNAGAAVTTPTILTANQPAAGVSGPAAGTAGEALTFTLSASEPYQSAGAGYTYRVIWGDGSAVQTVTGPTGTTVSHAFAAAGAYTAQVTAADSYGNTSATATATVAVVANRPTATVSGPSSGVQGQTLTYTLGASEAGLPTGTVYTFNIDWDGNGSVDQTVTGVSSTQISHAFSGTGACTVTVTAADPSGNASAAVTCPMTLTANQPTAGVGGPAAGTAGQALTFTLSASEPYQASGASYTYRVTWGDGSAVQTVTGATGTTVSHAFAAAGAYTVQVTATDSYGNTSAATTAAVSVTALVPVTVNRPTATVSGPSSGVQGQALTYTLGASETGLPAGTTYTFSIDWDGNGSVDQMVTGTSGIQVSHAFSGTGACTVTVTAADAAGTASTPVTCPMTLTANQPTTAVSGPAAGTAGQALTFTLSASEPYQASGAGYTYRVTWGDGSAVQTVTGVTGTAAGHTFANAGSYTVQVAATDSYGNTSAAATAATTVSNPPAQSDPTPPVTGSPAPDPTPTPAPPAAAPAHVAIFVTGADAGGGPDVKVYDAATGAVKYSFFAYDMGFTGGVRVAAGDVNGDGTPDVITAPGPGGGPDIHVYDGKTGALLARFFAYDPRFTGGAYVASGDVNGDGFADIVCGADAGGGPNVTVFSGKDHSPLASFFAYDIHFTGGVRVAAGDVNGDGRAEIIAGAGRGGGPNVTVFDGNGSRLASFFAFDLNRTGGLYVGTGDVNGDGRADIIAGAGAGAEVAVFDGATDARLQDYFAYDPAFAGGVRVTAVDRNGDGRADVVSVAGPGGGPDVRTVDTMAQRQLDQFFAYSPLFRGGLFVAAAD